MSLIPRILRAPRVSDRAFVLPVEPGREPEREAEAEAVEAEAAEPEAAEAEAAEPEPEPEPRPTAVEIDALIQERVKSFEERYQTEREAAYRAGFEDGRTQGLKLGRAESQEAIDRFAEVVDQLQERQRALVQENEAALVDLAVAVARRIVGAAAEVRREPVLLAVSDCLGYLRDRTRVTVKVNPKNLDAAREARKEWTESIEGIGTLMLEADPSVSPGGCVLETEAGDVDARIEERLAMLHTALLEELRTPGKTT
jgi:flagellar assembly protein FliH